MDDQRIDREGGGIKCRRLRIAWSVVCGIACVLLIVLWVRSYWWYDKFFMPVSNIEVSSVYGRLRIAAIDDPSNATFVGRWNVRSKAIDELMAVGFPSRKKALLSFSLRRKLLLPDWFLIVLLATLALVPWGRHRFSLRTLLIATALVAVVLGIVVYATR